MHFVLDACWLSASGGTGVTVYLVAPDLTGAATVGAIQLFAMLKESLEETGAGPIQLLDRNEMIWRCRPGTEDALVLANPVEGDDLAEDIRDLLEEAQAQGAVILPVATAADRRQPPYPVADAQSFDVLDKMLLRDLPVEALPVIAQDLAVSVLTRVQPTLTKQHLRLFLCHRRADGENVCRQLDRALSSRHENVFRDLVDVQHGDYAQAVIEQSLARADVLVFLDTPLAGDSQWVTKELALALGRGIPIVWVQMNVTGIQHSPLAVLPAAEPHLRFQDLHLSDRDFAAAADSVLKTAYSLAGTLVASASHVLAQVRRHARSNGLLFETLDPRYSIHRVSEPLPKSPEEYPRRPRVEVLQLFGHRPSERDHDFLRGWLEEHAYQPGNSRCRGYDAAIMLDPLPSDPIVLPEWAMVVDYGQTYARRLAGEHPVAGPARRLLLLGSFCEGIDSQEPVKQAVYAVATTWLARGGNIVFGGHPTFTPMIVEVGQRLLGDEAPEHIVVYQSRFYVTETSARALSPFASVQVTPDLGDRDSSLTAMRSRMIDEAGPASVVVAVGGRGDEGPGIDEEISLARDAGLPVYLLGAPGGRAAVLARSEGEPLNSWSREDNLWLKETQRYEEVAQKLWLEG